jgi:hypothetical protein
LSPVGRPPRGRRPFLAPPALPGVAPPSDCRTSRDGIPENVTARRWAYWARGLGSADVASGDPLPRPTISSGPVFASLFHAKTGPVARPGRAHLGSARWVCGPPTFSRGCPWRPPAAPARSGGSCFCGGSRCGSPRGRRLADTRQHALGRLEIGQPSGDRCPFGIEACKPLADFRLLCADLVQYRRCCARHGGLQWFQIDRYRSTYWHLTLG